MEKKISTWLAILIIVIVIIFTFLLFMTEGYKNWISREIADVQTRTICTAFLQAIIVGIVVSVVFEFTICYDKKKQDATRIEHYV